LRNPLGVFCGGGAGTGGGMIDSGAGRLDVQEWALRQSRTRKMRFPPAQIANRGGGSNPAFDIPYSLFLTPPDRRGSFKPCGLNLQPRSVNPFSQATNFSMIRHALVPPKPKELDMAVLTVVLRAVLGT
jgi:hypothetical protein